MSRSKRDQTMKFGQVIGYTNRNIFLENHAENETGRLVRDPFCIFNKALLEVKASSLQLSFNIF